MSLKQEGGEASIESKKRRRVGFAQNDTGIEANDCIKVYLVRGPDEVGETSSLLINPIDLNQFFGEDGKIYGYKNLKINVWMSSISFQAYADIMYEGTFHGGKESTDLKHALQDIFGESLLEKDEFLKTFSADSHYVRSVVTDGKCIDCESSKKANNASNSCSDATGSTTEVIRMELRLMPVGLLYSRLVPFLLLLVDGGSPVDISDPNWDIYFIVKKSLNQAGEYNVNLLGFSTVYRFFHYPDSTRFRVGQILVLPPYQGQGHGRRLLDSIYSTAISENAHDITFEEPSEYLQTLRTCNDTLRLLNFEPIKPSVNTVVQYLKENDLSKKKAKLNTKSHFAPPLHVINVVRQKLKINRKQFIKCWYVLIYLNLDIKNQRCINNFDACVFDRVKSEILAKDSDAKGRCLTEVSNDYGHEMTFVVMSSNDGEAETVQEEQGDREEQLDQLIQKQIDDVIAIANKVSSIKQ